MLQPEVLRWSGRHPVDRSATCWSAAMEEPRPQNDSKQDQGSGCLTRLSWMIFGNAALAICIVQIASHTGGFLSAADAVFWGVIPALIWLRHFDITRMGGRTASGEPATLSHWKRYAVLLLAFALAAWAAAHAVAWFWGAKG